MYSSSYLVGEITGNVELGLGLSAIRSVSVGWDTVTCVQSVLGGSLFGSVVDCGSAALNLRGAAGGADETVDATTDASRAADSGMTPDNVPTTFRGDSRPPSTVFDEGFQPQGDDLDLLRHAEYNPNSAYVSTSQSADVAAGFGPYVYEVHASGGVDVNAALGPWSPFPAKLEVAYPGGISSCYVAGCRLPAGDFVPNPGFGG